MFEAFVHPEILLRVFAHIVFNGAVDAGGVRLVADHGGDLKAAGVPAEGAAVGCAGGHAASKY